MAAELSETRIALNDIKPEKCDCSEINGLAQAYDTAVRLGHITHEEAVAGFRGYIDPDCEGRVPREQVKSDTCCFAGGCGVSEKVCKRSKYLIGMMMKVRTDIAT